MTANFNLGFTESGNESDDTDRSSSEDGEIDANPPARFVNGYDFDPVYIEEELRRMQLEENAPTTADKNRRKLQSNAKYT